MKRFALISVIMLSAFATAHSQNKVRSSLVWDIEKVSATIVGDSVEVVMKYVFIDDHVDRGAYVTLAPELKWIDKVYPMTPLSVCGLDLKVAPKKGIAVMTGRPGRKQEVKTRIPYDVSMNNFSISVRLSEYRAGKESKGERRQVAIFNRKPKPQIYLDTYLVEPPVSQSRERTAVIPLRLKYRSESDYELNLDDKSNFRAYDSFLAASTNIVLDARTRVSSITMSSYTSPEGSESENRKIASSRLRSVVTCLTKQKVFGKKKVISGSAGEDWIGIRNWVEKSAIEDESGFRSIVMNSESNDRKESRLKKECPSEWNAMKSALFGGMTRMECSIAYTIQDFYSTEELLDAYRTNPQFLDPRDYFRLLAAFEPYSYGWNEVLLRCAEMWPESEHANINMACLLIRMNKIHEAGSYLRKAGDSADAKYLRAVQMLTLGNTEAALSILKTLPENREEFDQVRNILTELDEWEKSSQPWDIQVYRFGQRW